MSDAYKDFNHVLKTFIRDLQSSYPDIKELSLMMGLYKIMKTMNRKMPQKYYHKLVAEKYSDYIIKKNFDFFLSDEFDDKEISYILKPLKNKFINLPINEQEMIWKHSVVLLSFSNKCRDNNLDYRS
jgi:hypothetical protein